MVCPDIDSNVDTDQGTTHHHCHRSNTGHWSPETWAHAVTDTEHHDPVHDTFTRNMRELHKAMQTNMAFCHLLRTTDQMS